MKNLKIIIPLVCFLAFCSLFFIKSIDDISEHVTLTYLTTGNIPQNNATEEILKELNKVLTRKANAELKIRYVPWDQYIKTYNSIIEAKDGSVDLVCTATDWLDAWPNAQKGLYLPLSRNMIKRNAPMTFATIPQEHWDLCKLDNKIYFIPEDNYAQWINHGFMYRKDWAKEAGLIFGIHSWGDLTQYFEHIRKNRPNVIPWDVKGLSTDYTAIGYIVSKSDYIPLEGISTTHMFGVNKQKFNRIYSPIIEGNEFIEYAKLMRYWASIGVWRENFSETKNTDNRKEFYQGKTAVDQHHTQTWYTIVCPRMTKMQPGSNCSFFWFGEERKNLTRTSITHGAMAISAASKNPERALKVYDLLRNDPECYYLINYGIKGKQYIINKEGYREHPVGYDANKDSFDLNFWWGRNDNLEIRDSESSWDKYDQITELYNEYAIDSPYTNLVWDLTNISDEVKKLNSLWNEYMPLICFGKADDPEFYVQRFRNELKQAGIETVLNELQMQLNSFNAKK